MNTGVSYSTFYEILLNLREYFYNYGRIDDSNAKLDEITKLIAISYSLAYREIHFDLSYVRKKSIEYSKKDYNIALGLRKVFEEESQQPMFRNEDGTNIFGAEPSLNIQPTEDDLAEKLISEIGKIDFINLIKLHEYENFDLINECFGHFVRDNFRNNKEDAQYMTPLEIVEPILDVIFNDMEKEGVFLDDKRLKDFIIMDPTCGVGTLLVQSSNYFTKYITNNIKDEELRDDIIANFRACGMIGQDKVDRMIRLSKINTLLLGGNISNINIGNSIVGSSSISNFKAKVDFIFTNPPFGAEYKKEDLNQEDYPLLFNTETNSEVYPSELLMLDKSISLLKDNGYLAIVLPDSVFSSKGIYENYRNILLKNIDIQAIFELPAVTFAQAGTRTNTCILYAKKRMPKSKTMYMAICNDVGYMVKERAGVQVKIEAGENEMLQIASDIINDEGEKTIISESPSITSVKKEDLLDNSLNPSFYAADRLLTVTRLKGSSREGFCTKTLSEIADFVTKTRKGMLVDDNIKHISVLHINPNTTISFKDVENFRPICKGRLCYEGDIIFSKINPQIPRMAVIPKTNYQLVCSNEFEILRAKEGIDPYLVCHLLRTEMVKKQILNLTSGTSSSHSRIKTEQLQKIMIQIPSDDDNEMMRDTAKRIRKATESIYSAEKTIQQALEIMETA